MVYAVVYSRVSTDEQDTGGQVKPVLDYCSMRGYKVLRVFEECIGGSTNPFDRPVFREMLEYIGLNSVDVVAMHDITRLYRPPPDRVHEALSMMSRIMSEYKVIVEFASEPRIDDPMLGELWRFIKSWVSGYERLQTQVRTRYGLLKRRGEGRWTGRASLSVYYASWIYDKPLVDVTIDEARDASKQLRALIMKYWRNGAVKKKMIAKLLEDNELSGLYIRYPRAPRSYMTIYRIVRGIQ